MSPRDPSGQSEHVSVKHPAQFRNIILSAGINLTVTAVTAAVARVGEGWERSIESMKPKRLIRTESYTLGSI